MSNYNYEDDDQDEHEDDILKDGESVRIPLYLLDSTQRVVAGVKLRDGLGQPAGSRPGYVYQTDDDEVAHHRERIREETKIELENAWRGGLQPGDTVTVGDKRGSLARASRQT